MTLLAVIAICAAVTVVSIVALVLVFAPPPTERRAAAQPAPDDPGLQEQIQRPVQAAAQAALDLYTSGNYGEFWGLWSADSQESVRRENYVRRFELCKPLTEGLPFVIRGVNQQGDVAKVEANRMSSTFSFEFHYEDGAWRYVPPADAIASYAKPVEEQVAREQAAGACAQR
ncbi:hypothetical protein HNP84_005855 [Thermocatellispora tengchongensis]|uniref:DUF4878 domain-containing protein n=1 Tax=Thermocatellispora tengchongensis TaxID=1073253 RepID=A0A840PE41_9ACTN|nr:hypothetical protein [Thermocatellispora tengchongensis]MBB5136111.1 hypothetical protein [Thermocatellispora tengchongensis]